ncbi:MAG: hypothetical protein IT513_09675 [Burkholderiales bacterium]|nr:hypothetical protein [Burkholderiales bacterium]
MAYYVYRLYERPIRRVEPLGEFARFPEAGRFAKARRAEPGAGDSTVRVVFAPNALAAEEALLNPREAPPRFGDDD